MRAWKAAAALFLALLTGQACPQDSASKAKDLHLQAYTAAARCGKEYATRVSSSTATASEIAEGATVACSTELRDAATTGRFWVATAMIERGVRLQTELDRAAEDAEANVHSKFRKLVLSLVIEARTPATR